jgi:hypothetical protein
VRRRLVRLGLVGAPARDEAVDPLGAESLALAGLAQAAVFGRAALGRRAGRGPRRLGADPDAPWVDRHVPLHAHEEGFDLHAAVHVEAGDRDRLTQLSRYLCRPPLGQHRLQRLRDGRVALALQRPWADGTTHLVFTPSELLARLVPLVPRPRVNLLLGGARSTFQACRAYGPPPARRPGSRSPRPDRRPSSSARAERGAAETGGHERGRGAGRAGVRRARRGGERRRRA